MLVLSLNCGSSSIKCKLFQMPEEREGLAITLSDLGTPASRYEILAEGSLHQSGKQKFSSYEAGLKFVLSKIPRDVATVAHRIVHGGSKFSASVIIDEKVIAGIEENRELAPLHNPPNLKGVRQAKHFFPQIPHVAVFDTGFHQTMPDYAKAYGLPYGFFTDHKIRRYGFHGISYRYVVSEVSRFLKTDMKKLSIVVCHLGSGCSIAAIRGGKSIDTSMGFTPAEGLMMRTRTGDIDPGVILDLQRVEKMSVAQINDLINFRSGLKGVSGGAENMQTIINWSRQGNAKARLAFDMFCYRVQKYIGAYAIALRRMDALVFTAGVGENEPVVRKRIVEGLSILGATLDGKKNLSVRNPKNVEAVHGKRSKWAILVIPTNEELMMARDAFLLARQG